VVLLSKLKGAQSSIEVEIDLDEMALTQAESKSTYAEKSSMYLIMQDLKFRNYI
jgi:hypothetical protein